MQWVELSVQSACCVYSNKEWLPILIRSIVIYSFSCAFKTASIEQMRRQRPKGLRNVRWDRSGRNWQLRGPGKRRSPSQQRIGCRHICAWSRYWILMVWNCIGFDMIFQMIRHVLWTSKSLLEIMEAPWGCSIVVRSIWQCLMYVFALDKEVRPYLGVVHLVR